MAIKIDPNRGKPADYKPEGAYGYMSDFLGSTIAGAGEVFGYEAPESVQEFRAENPVMGLGSELLGFAIPYGGYTGAARATRLPQYLNRIGNAERFPMLTGAARNMAFYAPFEAGRTAWGTAFGNMSTEEMLADNALGLALEGAFGAAGGFFKAVGKRDKFFEEVVGDINLADPPQLMLRRLGQLRQMEQDPEQIARLNEAIRRMQNVVLAQEPRPTGSRVEPKNYVDELDIGGERRQVNRLFTSSQSYPLNERAGFGIEERRDILSRAGLPESLADAADPSAAFETVAQYPRVVRERIGKKGTGSRLSKNIRENMIRVDDRTFIAREVDDGLFVVAKRLGDRIEVGKKGQPRREREWIVFKTDKPGIASPSANAYTGRMARENAWASRAGFREPGMTTPLYDEVERLAGDEAVVNYVARAVAGQSRGKRRERLKNALGLSKAQESEAVNRFGQLIDDIATPRMFQLTRRPLSRMLLMTTQWAFDLADTRAKKFLYGEQALDPGKNISKQVAFGKLENTREGIDELAAKLSPEDWEQFDTIWLERWDMDKLRQERLQGRVSTPTYRLLDRLNVIDDLINKETLDTQKLTGMGSYRPAKSHFLVPHVWEGKHRVFIRNDSGQVVWVAGGETHKIAKDRAAEILKEAHDQGRNWSASKVTAADSELEREALGFGYTGGERIGSEDALLAARAYNRAIKAHRRPRTFQERKDVGGFQSQFDRETFMEVVDRHLHERMNYLASLSARAIMDPHLQKLQAFGDTHALNVIMRRLEDFEGRPGALNKVLNNTVDKVLSPVLGKNSASQIASATNKSFMHLTLGAGNLSYSLISALTFLQTVVPHVAFIASAPPARLAPFYSWSMVAGKDGLPAGPMGHLNVFRLMKESFSHLNKPTPNFMKTLNRAANDGTIDPRLIEDYIGQTAEKVMGVREAFSSPGNFAEYILKLSEFGMAAPERWSRLHALSVGHLVGEKFLQLEGDRLYRFAKTFTDNTMFRYAVPDRPVLFAGPAGSIFGLFKNWMMHYMFSMGAYMGEAARGNWSPLLWQVAGTSAVGGVGAWPFYSLMDGFSKMASDDTLMENIYSTFNQGDDTMWSDAVYMGLPAMLGVSLTTQAQSVFNNPVHDASMLFSFVHLDRMVQLGKAVQGAYQNFGATGEWNVLRDQNTREQFARAVAPKTFYRSLSAIEEDSIKSLQTGYPLMKDVGLGTRVLYGLGLNTPEVERNFRVGRELWEDQAKRRAAVGAYGEAMAHALQRQDSKEAWRLMKKAAAEGIPADSIVRSYMSRMQKQYGEMIERSFSPEMIARHQASLGAN